MRKRKKTICGKQTKLQPQLSIPILLLSNKAARQYTVVPLLHAQYHERRLSVSYKKAVKIKCIICIFDL
jgi:hypothetical protein